MRSALLLAVAGILGLTVSGCDFGGGDTTVTPSPDPSPVAISPSPSPTAAPFAQPTVEPQESPRGILPPDLISSTDPDQRVQQVKGTRNDPFSLLPTTPTVEFAEGAAPTTAPTTITPVPRGATANPPARRTAQTPARPTTRASGPATGGAAGSTPGQTATGQNTGPRSPITANPPRPQPTLARAVEVTGIVQVGDTVYAIVNAPNESTSRYVQEGQRLSGGQVLVRRIETNRAEPVVVLEQAGVEVVRAVGEGGAAAVAPGSPAT
jgi:hypothetical protein